VEYDFLIVGSGLFGSVFANEMKNRGLKCLIIDKRNHIGGNCYTESRDGINIHKYGPHIFHTNDIRLWNYVNSLTPFNNFSYRPKVNYRGKIYSFPINLATLNQMWGVNSPTEAKEKLDSVVIKKSNIDSLEDWILSQVGEEIYQTFIYGYTKKQWGTEPRDLPASIIKRLPIRLTFDDNYYFDNYQGIPIGGYTKIFEKLLEGIEVKLGCDYFKDRDYFNRIAKKIVFTGKIDEYYNYRFGRLEYRSLTFEESHIETPDYQGVAGMNYTEFEVPHTRIIEHKHFEFIKSKTTWITKEYPKEYTGAAIPYYPLNDTKNNSLYEKYRQLALKELNVIFGGRLAEYKYYDMHQIIASALVASKRFL
jgi:UDP-galactopyranose mutase